MSVQTVCPKCAKKFRVADDLLGKKIKCPGCAMIFAVEDSAAESPDASEPRAKATPTTRKQQRPSGDEEDAVPRRPTKTASKAVDDDEEDERPKKSSAKKGRRDDDEEDEDDRPARKGKKKGSATTVLLILGGVGLFICAGGCGLGYYAYTRTTKAIGGAMTDAFAKLPTTKETEVVNKPSVGEALAGPRPATFPPEWKEFKDEKYGFSVMVPGTPKPDIFSLKDNTHAGFSLDVPAGQPLRVENSGYRIYYIEYKRVDNQGLEELTLEGSVMLGEAFIGGGKSTSMKRGSLAGKPGRAWNIESTKGGGVWYFRSCINGVKSYILAAGPEPKVSKADAEIFFSSFVPLSK